MKGKISKLVGMLLSIIVIASICYITFEDHCLPLREGNNAKIAYEYHIEKTGCTGSNCGPSCSLEARMWIVEYREDHNLTYEQFLCAVWYNDMQSWFYY